VRLPLLALVAFALAGCRQHTLEDGAYDFTTTGVLRDDCAVDGTLTILDRGTLTTTGNLVKIAFTSSKPNLEGTYKFQLEEMVLDGVIANYTVPIRGKDCLPDTLSLHMETKTVDPANFTGTTSITFQSLTFPECNCKYWYNFSATRVP